MNVNESENKVQMVAESPAVQTHLSIIQNVIQRMASNSASCKTWCVTLVSAILVVVIDKNKSAYFLLALLPILVFLILDAYYLSMEKGFRNSYNEFISKLARGTIHDIDLYSVLPTGKKLKRKSLMSYSILGFYFPLISVVLIASLLL
ncbi:hypothetical protein [Cobetia sp. MC34]|uniref:hypothetical protein n=1 Tax=Cobetia sp. MC34 TaxID=2785080 RepID=UPI001BC8CF84|nr:hypothetical protein [Cobetia sp. MC34]